MRFRGNPLWFLLAWACLLAALALLTTTEDYRRSVWLSLVLLALVWLFRFMHSGRLIRVTNLEAPMILFMGSAALATWISYDQRTAFLQITRMAAAISLFYSIIESNTFVQKLIGFGYVIASAGLAVYWPLQHNFTAEPSKFGWITELGRQINSAIPSFQWTGLTGPSIHNNVAAGVLALAAPFGAWFTIDWAKKKQSFLSVLAGLLTLVALAGLLMTASRGAWLSLAGAGVMVALMLFQRRVFPTPRKKILFWSFIALSGISTLLLVASTVGFDTVVGKIPDPGGSLQSRTALWRQGLNIIRDYPITGIGLRSFWMVHAVYYLLIHVPFIAHAHNTYLQIWIEQGVLGAAALLWGAVVVLSWLWKALSQSSDLSLAWAGWAGIFLLAFHGFIDVVFYIERTLPLVGFALAYAWLAVPAAEPHDQESKPVSLFRWVGVSLMILLFGAGVLFYRTLLSAWYSNYSAVLQSRLELSRYDPNHFDPMTLDRVREETDLSQVVACYEEALKWNPRNITALHRLSQIDLSLGKYTQATQYAQTAWNLGFRDEVTRLTMGDALVVQGEPEKVPQIEMNLSWAQARLLFQGYYRYWVKHEYNHAVDAFQAALLLDPQDSSAADWLVKAKQKLTSP